MKKQKLTRLSKIFRVKNHILSPRNPNKIWLDKNETNHFQINSIIKKSIKKIEFEDFYSYPNFKNLYAEISKKEKLKINNILVTNGADAAIKLIFETFIEENDEVMITSPSFAMYSVYANLYNAKIFKLCFNNINNRFVLDFDILKKKIVKGKIKALFLPNPDSPSGHYLASDEILRLIKLCKQKGVYLVIDEAYYPFSKETSIKLISKYNKLIIIRSGSKSLGLAGLRVGFVASNNKNINLLSKFRPIYEISNLSSKIYCYFYKNINEIKKIIKNLLILKKELESFLMKLKFEVIDTSGNFVLVNFGKKRKSLEKKLTTIAYVKSNISIDNEKYTRITLTEKNKLEKIKKVIKNGAR